MKTAFLCSGQGSQYVGMMKDIYEKYPEAAAKINQADEILGYSLSDICFNGPLDKLKETRYTQPALFVHSAVAFDLVKDKIECNAVAGHSVGEYAALYAAGVLSFEDALKLVSYRGNLMFSAGVHEPGTMFAIIGLADEKVVEICDDLTSRGNGNCVVPANFNSPGQIVVSGSAEYLRQNVQAFKEAGARMVQELVVSGAFHSPLMKPAKEELEIAISKTNFNDARIPVYTNVSAKAETNSADLKGYLIAQLMSPVRWTQILTNMKDDGISKYVEIGAGKVLQGLVKRTLNDVEILGFDKADDITAVN